LGEHGPVSDQLFHILLSLVDGPKHGYGIIQEVEGRTRGELTLGASTLYSAIKRIRARGWVEEVDAPVEGEDPRRRYYGLTREGRRVVREEARRLEALVRHARAKDVLSGRAGGGLA
jgi:DNA-binding PadR family transcriptional regulator